VQVGRANDHALLFQRLTETFPDLNYYDLDLPLALRHAAAYGSFPTARCRLTIDAQGVIHHWETLDTAWEIDSCPPPLRVLHLAPNVDPAYATPTHLLLHSNRFSYRLALQPCRPLLLNLRAILHRHDPDLLLTRWGDTWLLPYLLAVGEQWHIPLPLSRDPQRKVAFRRQRTYFSYGQVVHRGRQAHLFGRWHVDAENAVLYHDYGIEGILEMGRVTSLPIQAAARLSPGSGISAMQIRTALQMGILVPWHKQQAELPKTALDLLQSDQGGLVYQPLIGLHEQVAELDFVSMYPSIMARFNISPETISPSPQMRAAASDLQPLAKDAPVALIPQTLAPLLEKRLELKRRLSSLPSHHPARKRYKACASAHKWLLVTCFGYLGYKNARFGRIEAHEAVTAYGREALLRAKEAAEEQGFEVLHLYVDGLWVKKRGATQAADFQPLLDEITRRTALPIALEGIYRWVAFLPSRPDERIAVPNRYFGVFQDGSIKVRGLELRRRDTPLWIAEIQQTILEHLATAPDAATAAQQLPALIQFGRAALRALQRGAVPPQKLLLTQKLSRSLEEYRQPSAVARAAAQLQAQGKFRQAGQCVRFWYVYGKSGVRAWDSGNPPPPSELDKERYGELLLRALSSILQPFGVGEERLRQELTSGCSARSLSLWKIGVQNLAADALSAR
jgi:DNA polymerase-2